ncbi:bifunctional diaminohydroxyphosphoribosylaminopyrimidine deaminase/5-amino-6-(5-phosphoribosylamino)uracil reductase RibD [candidate division NPL-UPA2 bacterium Unc8]|uniref:Riboflavin biosynthesis protein RibD n=1 Tax=candidate division NPL-UPA2 bacterium Unc8 TaxID=1980939 RepID=A0A399FYX6_UNCN2|nr:Riboflavin biosynthesis protein RibD [Bacillota bacterium]MBT9138126.1 Riboflavin biosynthesis protein RibD [Bacillota bacterium]MBT9146351.1 Riboflavin biosynthesis protein RibD [Bacillota bacterium]RII00656.1 MAG: bifunctional diaminohydroxyphosphoribosylaminopyrimidine deaminase/5-amino-6-(5-phosphoribosylamino)uracil reductase RibD [candidate division NPL-UPA2 bacterium Unc8]
MNDERYMKAALRLAVKGRGYVSPNPMVGAVIVYDGQIVGKGYHKKAGLPHAEINALKESGEAAKGATLYVNLEPCNHQGKTPPCTDKIIEAGISKVVVAMEDPNPLNSGEGFRRLKSAGINVKTSILENEARQLNEAFIKFIKTGEPFITAKIAMSLDGKIATRTGESKWITGIKARKYVQKLRSEVDAILVGINTIIKDDPGLKAGNRKEKPIRIILDSQARIPLKARVLTGRPKTMIAITKYATISKINELKKTGAEVLITGEKGGKIDLKELMKKLGKLGVTSLLLEGGGEVLSSALSARVVDKALFFIAPKIIGGRDAPTTVGGEGIKSISEAVSLKRIKVRRFEEDVLIEGYCVYRVD